MKGELEKQLSNQPEEFIYGNHWETSELVEAYDELLGFVLKFAKKVKEAKKEFPKKEIRHVGEWGEYNEYYYGTQEITDWLSKWFGDGEE